MHSSVRIEPAQVLKSGDGLHHMAIIDSRHKQKRVRGFTPHSIPNLPGSTMAEKFGRRGKEYQK